MVAKELEISSIGRWFRPETQILNGLKTLILETIPLLTDLDRMEKVEEENWNGN